MYGYDHDSLAALSEPERDALLKDASSVRIREAQRSRNTIAFRRQAARCDWRRAQSGRGLNGLHWLSLAAFAARYPQGRRPRARGSAGRVGAPGSTTAAPVTGAVLLSGFGALLARLGVVRMCLALLTGGAPAAPRYFVKVFGPTVARTLERLVGEVRKLPPELHPRRSAVVSAEMLSGNGRSRVCCRKRPRRWPRLVRWATCHWSSSRLATRNQTCARRSKPWRGRRPTAGSSSLRRAGTQCVWPSRRLVRRRAW